MTYLINKIWHRLLRQWWGLSVPIRLRKGGIELGNNVIFHGMPLITAAPNSKVSIGDRTVFASHNGFTALGVSRPCIIRTTRQGAEIIIGPDTGVSGVSICAALSVKIGRECLIGADVMIVDNDFHPVSPERRRYLNDPKKIAASPVSIGDNVFIGARSLVLKGVHIGENSVIGAGSVVVSDIPPNSLAAGSPARVIRKVD